MDPRTRLSRRTALLGAGALATALGVLDLVRGGTSPPRRRALDRTVPSAPGGLPDIQFDIGAYLPPAQAVDGVLVQMPPVHTVFLTARLLRTPTRADQAELARALATLELVYPFAADGLMTFVAYGLPYLRRLPASVVDHAIPRLAADHGRPVLEEAVPGPTDVAPANPGITKRRYPVPVRIERNDMVFTLRGDSEATLRDALSWLGGAGTLAGRPVRPPAFGGLLAFTSSRAMFAQRGLPRYVAETNRLPYARYLHPDSPMWMGFADQQADGAGPAAICTFAGNGSARLTTARPGDYFDHGSVQHLSHVILDLLQFFDMDGADAAPGDDGVFTERVQYMFRSTPPPSAGNADQYLDGGGPAFLPNQFRGVNDALLSAQGIGTPDGERRLGHLSGLQRSSRAADGTALHLRMDGPGFDAMDVPDGSGQPKLQFTIFVPTADFFATMRRNQASLDLAGEYGVPDTDNGLERFLTATRRQNFLVPPRRHRAFPLLELL